MERDIKMRYRLLNKRRTELGFRTATLRSSESHSVTRRRHSGRYLGLHDRRWRCTKGDLKPFPATHGSLPVQILHRKVNSHVTQACHPLFGKRKVKARQHRYLNLRWLYPTSCRSAQVSFISVQVAPVIPSVFIVLNFIFYGLLTGLFWLHFRRTWVHASYVST